MNSRDRGRDLREKFVRQAEWIGRKMEREIQAEMNAKPKQGESMNYPKWAVQALDDYHYRLAEGDENKPDLAILGMLEEAYHRGLTDAREAIEAGIEKAEEQRDQLVNMLDIADKGRVITGLKTARGLVLALQRGERPYWREIEEKARDGNTGMDSKPNDAVPEQAT